MPERDWEALERSEQFDELVRERRRFVVPALIVFVVWFGGFLVLTAYGRDFMGKAVVGNVTWAWVLAASMIVMTWGITWSYGRFADRRIAPLVERAAGRSERGAMSLLPLAAVKALPLVDLRRRARDHARDHLLGGAAHDSAPRTSGPPAAASRGSRTAWPIAGDYMSAAAFLGVSGLIFLFGFDGYITGVAALVSFIPVLLLLAERMRNAGKYTMADVLAFRLRGGPARTAAAIGTLIVATFYLRGPDGRARAR